jgi:hypothetical protein
MINQRHSKYLPQLRGWVALALGVFSPFYLTFIRPPIFERAHKELWTVQQTLLKPGNAVECVSVGKPAFGVDRFALFNCSPAAYRVKILKREPYWVHQIVTARADSIGAVLGQPFTHRKGCRYRIIS